MSDTPAANTSSVTPFSIDTLTIQSHLDPDKHFIGDALPAPSEAEVTYSGTDTSAGSSPFPARADHSHDIRTRQTYVSNAIPKSVAAGAGAYVTGLATASAWEDFLHPSSTQIVDFPIEGVYTINSRITINRSTGAFPATTSYSITFAYTNATSLHVVEANNLPQGRTNFTSTITEIISYAVMNGNQNIQFFYNNDDTVAHNFTVRTIIQRTASSIEAETD